MINFKRNKYKLNTETSQQCLLARTKLTRGITWHCRLGHCNSNEMFKMGLCDGISCNEIHINKYNIK